MLLFCLKIIVLDEVFTNQFPRRGSDILYYSKSTHKRRVEMAA